MAGQPAAAKAGMEELYSLKIKDKVHKKRMHVATARRKTVVVGGEQVVEQFMLDRRTITEGGGNVPKVEQLGLFQERSMLG